MSIAAETSEPRRRVRRIDALTPLLAVVGLLLCGLILLPLGWLVWYSLTDDAGQSTFGNFVRLASDPTFALPYLTALGIAAGVAVGSCAAALPLAWLAARTDMPLARPLRMFVTASFVTPPFRRAE
jgi:iron(III) transport system permease protein